MNYNAKHGDNSLGGIRRIQNKRVIDVNAMGYSAPQPNSYAPNTFPAETNTTNYNYNDPMNMNSTQNQAFTPNYTNPATNQPYYDPYNNVTPQYGQQQQQQQQQQHQQQPQPQQSSQPSVAGPNIFNPNAPNQPSTFPGQFAMLQQPVVQDMAMQYGQRLAAEGKQMVEKQFEKYVPVTHLKYYFAVDNNYVVKKLILLLFPYTRRDWSLKYDQDNPVQPRYDLNAPDLYIPTMAYITFVVLAGLVMGMQNRFSPEQLGIISSNALAYTLIELLIYWLILYGSNITGSMKLLDLVTFSGYKFVMINLCIVVSIIFKRFGFYLTWFYTSIAVFFFLLRTLKAKILRDATTTASYDAYGNVQQTDVHTDYSMGRKRKLTFLFLFASLQPILMYALSWHLIPSKDVEPAITL